MGGSANVSNAQLLLRINKIDETLQAVLSQNGRMSTDQALMCKDLNRMTATLDELQRTIRGSNGTPGIVTQLGELTMKVNRLECNDTIDQLDQAIRGTNDAPGIAAQMSKLAAKVDKIDVLERVLDGDEKNSGLIERVRKLEDIQKELRYWFYLASGAVLLWVINGILDWLPKLSTLLSQ